LLAIEVLSGRRVRYVNQRDGDLEHGDLRERVAF
jgi:hypothetical protein